MKTNEFAKMSQMVAKMVDHYHLIRKECKIADNDWHVRTIDKLAKPFLKGFFTIAVVGKVSSGKSTFINALLGCKNLLPTGHDQTTCGITYIEYGEEPEATITFGDGHQISIKKDIAGKIKSYVAIPEKYHNLPVNHIDDMIMGNFDFDKIWAVKDQLEAETLCAKINESLLRDYVSQRSKKDIAIKVRLKYPFNDELKGWRIIDTPGIGAIGGIETRTKQLLSCQKEDGSREVDAIIFLQNGSQTLDQTDTKKFVKEQLDNFSESDKHRLFYVLTHSGDLDFRNHKEGKIDFLKQNYEDKIMCLTYADSLLYSFINDVEASGVDLKLYDNFQKPDDWADDEWQVIMNLLDQAKRSLKNLNDSFNHDTMYRTIKDWAHFDELKEEVNKFAKNERLLTLRELVHYIATDYLGFVKHLNRDRDLVDGDLDGINKAIEETENKKLSYNELARKADNEIKIDDINNRFQFIDEDLQKFESLDSIPKVRTAITNLFDKVQTTEKDFFQSIIKTFSDFFMSDSSEDIIIDSIDFKEIEDEATSKSEEEYKVSSGQVITHVTRDDERIPAVYDIRVNPEKKLRNFKALAIKRARSTRDKFLPQIKEKIDNMRNCVFDELEFKIEAEKRHLEDLKKQLTQKEKFKAHNNAYIEKSHKAGNELIQLINDYENGNL